MTLQQQAKTAYTKTTIVVGAFSGVFVSAFIGKHEWVNAALFAAASMAGGYAAYRHYQAHDPSSGSVLKVRTLLWKFLKTFVLTLIGISIVQIIYMAAQ